MVLGSTTIPVTRDRATPMPEPKPPITPQRLAANRANARKSTGPKIPEGKTRSRANALQHGLASQGEAPTPEMEAQFEELTRQYAALYRPANEAERGLVRAAAWGACRFDTARRRQLAQERLRLARAAFEARAAREAAVVRLPTDPAG